MVVNAIDFACLLLLLQQLSLQVFQFALLLAIAILSELLYILIVLLVLLFLGQPTDALHVDKLIHNILLLLPELFRLLFYLLHQIVPTILPFVNCRRHWHDHVHLMVLLQLLVVLIVPVWALIHRWGHGVGLARMADLVGAIFVVEAVYGLPGHYPSLLVVNAIIQSLQLLLTLAQSRPSTSFAVTLTVLLS